MLKKNVVVASLVVVFLASASIGISASGVSVEGVKCLMAPKKSAKADKSSAWKKGKVFFCCDKCKGGFDGLTKAAKDKLAAKANHQLVASKQYTQKACPISGGKLKADTKIKVGAAELSFCCDKCKDKAKKLDADKQIAEYFGEKAFKTAKFELVKAEE